MGGGKGGEPERLVTNYYMSLHYGICHGPIDALLGIYIKERDAWPGTTEYDDDDEDQEEPDEDAPIVTFKDFIASLGAGNEPTKTDKVLVDKYAISINRMDLFGGDEKEGGVRGTAVYLPGKTDQVLPANLAKRLGQDQDDAPGFRNIASVFFVGGNGGQGEGWGFSGQLGDPEGGSGDGKISASGGFLWCQNNPYLPPAWFTVYRRPKGLTLTKATVQRGNNPPDANPAHLIYECLSNEDWGMGAPDSIIDVQSFEKAGNRLKDEKFGLSMIWNEQATIEDFVKEVIDHIQATLFVDPDNGLLTIKLIRDGYTVSELDEYNEDNCNATNRQRKAWGETTNEIVVTWTNPTNEMEETITYQDLANIAMQGGINSDSRNYYGVRNKELAKELAIRDIRTAAAPLFSTDIECDRSAWRAKPGDVVKFSWKEDGIDRLVCRVGKVDYGKPGDPKVKIALVEDVFSLEKADYDEPPSTGWESPNQDPQPLEYTELFTLPYPAVALAGLTGSYPDGFVGIFGAQPGGGTEEFVPEIERNLPNGDDVEKVKLGNFAVTPYSQTTDMLPREAISDVSRAQLGLIVGRGGPEKSGFLYIGSGEDSENEIALFGSYDKVEKTYRLRRGQFDTIPREWPAGTPVWYVGGSWRAYETRPRPGGSTPVYKLRTRTFKGLLPRSLTPPVTVNVTDRAWLPFRPAKVALDGVLWGLVEYDPGEAIPTSWTVSWATRNRLMEDVRAARWTDDPVTPEDGQTTTVRVTDLEGTVIIEYEGLTGNSQVVPSADLPGSGAFIITVLAVNEDGLESLQNADVRIIIHTVGYGNDYGFGYGEGM